MPTGSATPFGRPARSGKRGCMITEVQTGDLRATRAGDATSVLVAGEETAGRFALVETRERRDAIPPCHVHAHEDEIVYVLEGHVVFAVGDETLDAPAGTCVLLPRGGEHTFRVESPDARLLVLVAPTGLEGYYRELDRPDARAGVAPGVERLVATAARYGIAITGPPPATGASPGAVPDHHSPAPALGPSASAG